MFVDKAKKKWVKILASGMGEKFQQISEKCKQTEKWLKMWMCMCVCVCTRVNACVHTLSHV